MFATEVERRKNVYMIEGYAVNIELTARMRYNSLHVPHNYVIIFQCLVINSHIMSSHLYYVSIFVLCHRFHIVYLT